MQFSVYILFYVVLSGSKRTINIILAMFYKQFCCQIHSQSCAILFAVTSTFSKLISVTKIFANFVGQYGHSVGTETVGYPIASKKVIVNAVMRSSHRRHGQDKTRQDCLDLFCPCRRCEQNWRQVKTVCDRKFRN